MAIIISYPTATNVTLSDRLLGTQFDGELGTSVTKNFSISSVVNLAKETIAPYNVYTALLSQSGLLDPVAIVLQNTLGTTVSWNRESTGEYSANITGNLFVEGKTFVSITRSNTTDTSVISYWITGQRSTNNIVVLNQTGIDYDGGFNNGGPYDGFENISVEIRVYN